MSEKYILIVSSVFPPEPLVSGRLSSDIAGHLSKTDKVVVICPAPTRPIGSNYIRTDFGAAYQVITLDSYTHPKSEIFGRLRESYSFGKKSAEFIRDNHDKIKIIYANTHPIFGQYLLLSKAKEYSIPVVLHIQDVYPESITLKLGVIGKIMQPLLLWYDKIKQSSSSKIIAISDGMKDYLIKSRSHPQDKVEVVYNWQEHKQFLKPYQRKDRRFTYMFVGSLSPSADLETVINAFGKASMKDARLVIAGGGTMKQVCENLAKTYPDVAIDFMDASPDNIPSIQNEADILILSLKKGIGKTALPSKFPAYLFSAKPIICCTESDADLAKMISSNNCGWICHPESPAELEVIMAKCRLKSEEELASIGKNSRNFGIATFSKTANLSKICKIITTEIQS